jgi:hypothetical protein
VPHWLEDLLDSVIESMVDTRSLRDMRDFDALSVEHNLAKVGVEGSNPFARSKIFNGLALRARAGLWA